MVGVPVIALPFTDKPGGSPLAVHVYGAVPPVSVSAAVYPAFTVPEGSGDVFVTLNIGGTMISRSEEHTSELPVTL